MRTHQRQLLYRQLEFMESPATSGSFQQGVIEVVQRAWMSFWNAMATQDEPQFKERRDRRGQPYWQVYDPVADRTFHLDSLQTVLEWLENRHN
ncbi:hypothetical protein H6G89_20945 [Oscillatoria sp. FACHB-1407]|uniref:hypothetical protein n=1 Tax=Oscillatoria sp. FACHB-1407 TaxID=2692847 RepID=UPI0016880BD6|nr:hypothetical protein [Oscillatoria sp. FACHB-1407]MBD2463475.1 hypothetical protein [Oscillatoria sp. FACHB-1407]